MNKKLKQISAILVLGAFALAGCSDNTSSSSEKSDETTQEVKESVTEGTVATSVVETSEIKIPEASKILKVMDGETLIRTEGFDETNNLIFETGYDNGALVSEIYYEYNEDGFLGRTVEKTYGQFNGELTTVFTYDYDGYLINEAAIGKYTGEGVTPYDSEIMVEYIYDYGLLVKKINTRTDHEADTYVTTISTTLEYENDKLTVESNFKVGDDGSETLISKIEYSYDENGKVSEKRSYTTGAEPNSVSTYEYADGVIVSEKVVSNGKESTYTYTYETK